MAAASIDGGLSGSLFSSPVSPRSGLGDDRSLACSIRIRPSIKTRGVRRKESLAGVRIPPIEGRAEGGPTMLGFGGNAWNSEAMALTLHMLLPHRDVVALRYRGYAPSSGRPTAQALFSDSLVIFDHLQKAHAGEHIIVVGFSIGSGVAASLVLRPCVTMAPESHSA